MRHLRALALTTVLWTAIGTSAAAQTPMGIAPSGMMANATPAASKVKTGPSYETLISNALKTAKADHKTVWVYFGGLGCGWCHQLHHTLHSLKIGPTVSKYFVLVPVFPHEDDAHKYLENAGADSAAELLGLKDKGTPKYAFLDTAGKAILTGVGYPEPVDFPGFAKDLKKAAPQMTDEDLTIIMDYFKERGEEIEQTLAKLERRAAEDRAKAKAEADAKAATKK